MHIQLIGLNHKTAPIEIRERFYLNENKRDLFLSELKSRPEVIEAFVLSTCNRTEIYLHTIDSDNNLIDYLQLLAQIKGIKLSEDSEIYFYQYAGQKVLHHLFSVSAGLDSLVLGEKQIIGQIRMAFDRAKDRGILGRNFNILANTAIRVGKKARNETDIGIGGSSVSWAAIRKAQKEFGNLQNKKVLIIGAGKMSKLTVGQIQSKGFKKLYVMNRTPEHAQRLAKQFGGEYVSFCDMKEVLADVDLCICSSSAPHYILDKRTVEKAINLSNHNEKLFIDISMPRNIDPKIKDIAGVNLYHIDELNIVVAQNMRLRENAIEDVKIIIEDKIQSYYQKIEKINYLELNDKVGLI